MELAPVLTELGTTVAVLAIFGWLIWKLVTPLIGRLMDNLDRMAASYENHAEAQARASLALDTLCRRLDEVEDEHHDRTTLQDTRQREVREAQQEIVGALRGLQQQFQAHEGRAHTRHEQQMKAYADHEVRANQRHEQQLEESRQVVKALKALNGHS